ncbi:MAG: ParB/RepB/Spo0J family partition protein [Fibromonadaceae bacterium]|jgi:ParB family chromosome partitioning protein|nr:ParB/RepB/Spo0J family partition protein [Fibromonadaceae bacterium]
MGKKAMGGGGLASIIRDHSVSIEGFTAEKPGDATKILLEQIDANPFQPRKHFKEESLLELAESIKQHGILEPVLLRKNAGRYQIVSGERRVRAAKLAGLSEIEARVFDFLSNKTMAEWAIIENIQREDLNPIEIADSYKQLLENHEYTHEDLAARLNKSRAAVTNSLRLLNLPKQVQEWIGEGKLSAGAARALLSPNIKNPEKAAREIIEKGLSAREAEVLAQKLEKNSGSVKKNKVDSAVSPDMQSFLNFLQNAFGTKVECKKNAIIIYYSSYSDLTRIQQSINPRAV